MSLDTIVRFYEAFGRRDGDAMAACYTPGAHFSDPVFQDLEGPEVGAMWQMLTSTGRDLQIQLVAKEVEANQTGSAHWLADYTFSRTGRHVHNDVHATFHFADDGLIADHHDSFNFYKWSKQALGPVGSLLGWAPPFQSQLRAGAIKTLAKYMAERLPADGEPASR